MPAAVLIVQITIDLPDDVLAKADAVARQESRSLGSVIAELVRGMRSARAPMPAGTAAPGHRFPVVEGRPVTEEEMDRLLEEDRLP